MLDAMKFDHVEKGYGDRKVFQNFSYSVRNGECVAFLGANGAGKSTFLNLASGLLRPDRGTVAIFGAIAGDFQLKHRIRFLPQELVFPPQLTVRELMDIACAHYRAEWPTKLLSETGVDELLSRRAGNLSGGEVRRIGLALSLVGDPELIMLDEPTSSLDLEGQKAIQEVLVSHLRRTGATMIFSSHRMSEVEVLGGRITVINRGRILADGPTDSIRRQFGMSKVSFSHETPIDSLATAKTLNKLEKFYEAIGPDSDSLLREVVSRFPKARDIAVQKAPLEDVIFHLWSKESE